MLEEARPSLQFDAPRRPRHRRQGALHRRRRRRSCASTARSRPKSRRFDRADHRRSAACRTAASPSRSTDARCRSFATPSARPPRATFADASMHRRQRAGGRARRHADRDQRLDTRGRTAMGARPAGARPQRAALALDLDSGSVQHASPTGSPTPSASAPRATTSWFSESWRHRLVAIDAGRTASAPCSTHLPVYPSRLSPAAGGGFWLTAFAARSQLVEFVLRETAYRRRMMAEIDPDYWIAPKLRSGQSFLEPLQGGTSRPWASSSRGRRHVLRPRDPARRGRRAALRAAQPGRRRNHGVVAAVEIDGALFAIAKGPGRLLRMPLARHRRRSCAHERPILELRKATKVYAGVPAIEDVDFKLRARRDPCAGRRERRRQVDADQDDGRRRHADLGDDAGRRRRGLRRARRRRRGISASRMVYQENSLVPSLTVAQNLFLGQERFSTGCAASTSPRQQFLQSLNFHVDPTATVGPLGAGQEADGRDRARRASQRPGHHLRRADRDADAGGEASFLRPGRAISRSAACRSSSSRMRWRRR